MRHQTLQHEFVEHFTEQLQEGVLYVSVQYATAAHKCCCGCGNDVYTPLSPTDWKLTFDGRTISLYPSIGNWSFPCQSHYFITKNRVEWARRWSREEIAAGRANDSQAEQQRSDTTKQDEERKKPRKRWWRNLTMWF